MFSGRFNLFVCDFCGIREYAASFPSGWVWIKTGGRGVEHCCTSPSCIAKVPDGAKVKQPGELS